VVRRSRVAAGRAEDDRCVACASFTADQNKVQFFGVSFPWETCLSRACLGKCSGFSIKTLRGGTRRGLISHLLSSSPLRHCVLLNSYRCVYMCASRSGRPECSSASIVRNSFEQRSKCTKTKRYHGTPQRVCCFSPLLRARAQFGYQY
jgi:hypothetical protein